VMILYTYILVEVPAGFPTGLAEKIRKFEGVLEAKSVYGARYDIVVRADAEKREGVIRITDSIQSLGRGILTVTLEAKEE